MNKEEWKQECLYRTKLASDEVLKILKKILPGKVLIESNVLSDPARLKISITYLDKQGGICLVTDKKARESWAFLESSLSDYEIFHISRIPSRNSVIYMIYFHW